MVFILFSFIKQLINSIYPMLQRTFLAIVCLILVGCDDQLKTIQPKAVPVQVVTLQNDVSHSEITLSGVVVPRIESQLAFQVAGRIIKRVVEMGDNVVKGDVLAQLDETPFRLAIEEASAELSQLKTLLSRVQRDVERQRGLVRSGAIALADFDALETLYNSTSLQVRAAQSRLDKAHNALTYTTLTAAIDGTIALVQAETGQVVAAGTPIIRLAQSREADVQVDVPESKMAFLATAQQVKVNLLSLPERELIGVVREIATVADPLSRTFRMRISLSELPSTARLGMTAKVRLDSRQGKQVFQLPITALFQMGEQTAVWVLPAGEKYLTLRLVSVEEIGTDTIFIAGGIKAGEQVVTAGVHRLDSEIPVQVWDGRLP